MCKTIQDHYFVFTTYKRCTVEKTKPMGTPPPTPTTPGIHGIFFSHGFPGEARTMKQMNVTRDFVIEPDVWVDLNLSFYMTTNII